MSKMNKEEKNLLDSYEKSEWKSVKGSKFVKRRYLQYARYTMRKNQRINIRISQRDLEEIQKKALEEGMPYQTLIASILHKFVSGRFAARS